ncbi:TolC family protein [Pedobacter panaciterrae]
MIRNLVTEVNLNENVLLLEPEQIYNEAELQFGTVRSSELKILSAEKDLALAKSNLYPQLNFSASSGTNYSSTYHESLPDGQIQVMPWGKQLQNNFSQSIYLGLSIPIFNGLSSRYGIKQAKASIQINKLQSSEAKLKLRQDIYKACNEALTAFQTYRASRNGADMAQTGLDFAQKRYEKGLIPAIDLLLAQNTAFKANADVASSKYDLIFKLMVIDYYLGRNLFE